MDEKSVRDILTFVERGIKAKVELRNMLKPEGTERLLNERLESAIEAYREIRRFIQTGF